MQIRTLSIPLIVTSLLLVGCVEQPPVQEPKKIVKQTKKNYMPPPPKKDIKLKEVEDENFSSEYMYPETDKKSRKKSEEKINTTKIPTVSPAAAMTNTECISMIGQEKFDKYTQMLGSEAGAVKKCAMLRAL